jgi:hypothetical protein
MGRQGSDFILTPASPTPAATLDESDGARPCLFNHCSGWYESFEAAGLLHGLREAETPHRRALEFRLNHAPQQDALLPTAMVARRSYHWPRPHTLAAY